MPASPTRAGRGAPDPQLVHHPHSAAGAPPDRPCRVYHDAGCGSATCLPARADGHRKRQIVSLSTDPPLGLQNPHHTGGQQPGRSGRARPSPPPAGRLRSHQRSPAECQPGQSHDSASDVAAGSSAWRGANCPLRLMSPPHHVGHPCARRRPRRLPDPCPCPAQTGGLSYAHQVLQAVSSTSQVSPHHPVPEGHCRRQRFNLETHWRIS